MQSTNTRTPIDSLDTDSRTASGAPVKASPDGPAPAADSALRKPGKDPRAAESERPVGEPALRKPGKDPRAVEFDRPDQNGRDLEISAQKDDTRAWRGETPQH